MNEGILLAHLDIDDKVGMVHIRANLREQVGKLAADVLADLGRSHRELLVAALGLDLEGLSRRKIGRKIVLCGRNDAFERLFRADRRAGDSREAEYTARAFHNGIGIRIIRDFHVNDRLTHGNFAVRYVRHAALEVLEQTVLKGFSVESLEDDFAAFEQ